MDELVKEGEGWKNGVGGGAHKRNKEERALLREKAFNMRVMERLDYRDIAKRLDISPATAMAYSNWIINDRKKGIIERDEEIRAKQTAIYERLLDRWVPTALQTADNALALDATDKVTKVMVDQAKLHGFQAPKTQDAKKVGRELAEGVFESMQRLAKLREIKKAEVIENRIEDKEDGPS